MSTTTRWWWIRHAPVVEHGGRIYGQQDLDCDVGHAAVFDGLAHQLPADAVWVTTHLRRTRRTAEAILHRRPDRPALLAERELAEQHFGDWQGRHRDELIAERGQQWDRFWLAPAHERPPGGESFVDLMARVHASVERLSAAHAGRDIVAVTHGGTIRAALAHALGLEPERALAFVVDNCSLTRIDRIDPPADADPDSAPAWRVALVNHAARVPREP
jgi:broad specificity phosphatase PhoE